MLFEEYFDEVYTRYYVIVKGAQEGIWYFVKLKSWNIPEDEYYEEPYENPMGATQGSEDVRDEYKNRKREGSFWIITNNIYTGKIRSEDRKYGIPFDPSRSLKYDLPRGNFKKLQGVILPDGKLSDIPFRVLKKTGGARLPTKTRRDFLLRLYAEILQKVAVGDTVPLSNFREVSFSTELHDMYIDLKKIENPSDPLSIYIRTFTSYKDRFYRLLYGLKQLGMIELTEDPESKEIFITPLRELGELQNVASDEAFFDVTSTVF